MNNQVSWEWTIEVVDIESGDIVDSDPSGKLSDHLQQLADGPEPGFRHDLVLVCDIGNEWDGLVERGYAYVEDGKLPESAVDAYDRYVRKVPKRYRDEFGKAFRC